MSSVSLRLAPARRSTLLGTDIGIVVAAVFLVTTGMWVRGGGLGSLGQGVTEVILSLGRLTGLYAALFALGGLILAARPRQLERKFGLDTMLSWHRVVGAGTVLLVLVHAVLDTAGWVSGAPGGPGHALRGMLAQPWMVAALAGAGLFLTVGLSSWRRLRALMSYETWYFVHASGYLAVLLAFGHQLVLGTDIAGAPVATGWWVLLFGAAAGFAVYSRMSDLFRSVFRRRLAVSAVAAEAPGVSTIRVAGPGLRGMRVSAGQFFMLRVLRPGLWWQAHPFSISAPPSAGGLRFTIKELGDGTAGITRVRPGTRVLLEGPYGTFTAERAQGHPVAVFGAGVGMGPLVAVLHDITPGQRPEVFVRARTVEEVLHLGELRRLVAEKGGRLHLLLGPRPVLAANDPLRPRALSERVPDIAGRHVFLCGPASFEHSVERALRALGTPTKHIHRERFGI